MSSSALLMTETDSTIDSYALLQNSAAAECNQHEQQSHAYSIRIRNNYDQNCSQTKVRLSYRVIKIAAILSLTLIISFLADYLLEENCLQSFDKYQCADRGKHSEICQRIMECLRQSKPYYRKCSVSGLNILLVMSTLIFFYFTIEHRNPLIKFKVIKSSKLGVEE